ncbi:MAG: HAD family hydrolase, partial [Oscillospiraceae bacterium]|nr:HAD family hydrolase [Oscillospiraceae bacterium]
LQMQAEIGPFSPMYFSRIAQLTNKSNQFNLTTRRFTQAEIEAMAGDEHFVTLYGRLSDKFGDNGVVSVAAGEIKDGTLDIILWLMSCRVLKRDMEFAMMDALAAKCLALGIGRIRGFYFPTARNGMVRDFYAGQGFTRVSGDEAGNTVWELDLRRGYENRNHVIETQTI